MNLLQRYTHWLHGRWPAGHVEALPVTDDDGRTNVPGLTVAGDLRGIPLLKLSADTGAKAAAAVAEELGKKGGGAAAGGNAAGAGDATDDVLDLVIVGAGVAGMAAAIASGEYQARNILSTKCCTDQVAVLSIKGIAITRTSRYPPAMFHRSFKCCILDSSKLPTGLVSYSLFIGDRCKYIFSWVVRD